MATPLPNVHWELIFTYDDAPQNVVIARAAPPPTLAAFCAMSLSACPGDVRHVVKVSSCAYQEGEVTGDEFDALFRRDGPMRYWHDLNGKVCFTTESPETLAARDAFDAAAAAAAAVTVEQVFLDTKLFAGYVWWREGLRAKASRGRRPQAQAAAAVSTAQDPDAP